MNAGPSARWLLAFWRSVGLAKTFTTIHLGVAITLFQNCRIDLRRAECPREPPRILAVLAA